MAFKRPSAEKMLIFVVKILIEINQKLIDNQKLF